MLEAHVARLAAEERLKRSKEKRRNTLEEKEREWKQMMGKSGSKFSKPLRPLKVMATFDCEQGTIRLHMLLDGPRGGAALANIDYRALQLVTTTVRIEILPADSGQAKVTRTLPAAEAVELI